MARAETEGLPVFMSAHARTASALMALGVVAAMTAALVAGLRVDWQAQRPLALIAVRLDPPQPETTPEPTPEPPPPQRADDRPAPAPQTAPARADAAPVIAANLPPLIVPPPVPAATQAGSGNAASGNAGGAGNGNGGGGGTGGDGAGAKPAIQAKQTRGRLKFSDLPIDLLEPGKWAEVKVRYTVNSDGRVGDCAVGTSSGVAALDAMACRLIVQRFRFRPARNAAGTPIASTIVETHAWFVRPDDKRS